MYAVILIRMVIFLLLKVIWTLKIGYISFIVSGSLDRLGLYGTHEFGIIRKVLIIGQIALSVFIISWHFIEVLFNIKILVKHVENQVVRLKYMAQSEYMDISLGRREHNKSKV